ncbi:hypothetical protein QQ045_022808 [Rhodiola kirilowii]
MASSQASTMASEVQRSRPINAAKNVVKSVEPVAGKYAVSAWQTMNKLPLFPHVAHVVISTAAYCAEKYNQAVDGAAERGYAVASVVPLIPVERIGKEARIRQAGGSYDCALAIDDGDFLSAVCKGVRPDMAACCWPQPKVGHFINFKVLV